MKTFKQWLISSTDEVRELPEMGQKLAYAMYRARYNKELLAKLDQKPLQGNMIGFAVSN